MWLTPRQVDQLTGRKRPSAQARVLEQAGIPYRLDSYWGIVVDVDEFKAAICGKRTELYRHYDKSGVLLYVGISLSTVQRAQQHKKATWWRKIARIDIEPFLSRESALNAERIAIQTEKPLHNRTHNRVDN